MKWELKFISKNDFYEHVRNTIANYGKTLESINLKKFNENIIDPIKLTFDSIVYFKKIEKIISEEISRQRDKTNNNIIGYFNQNIFKYIKKCEIPKKEWDIIFNSNFFIEMKNKYNTMNSSSSARTYIKMQNKIINDKKSICFLVEVIAKTSQNVPWIISIDGLKYKNDRIRRISIDKFYEIVTGDKNAFLKICKVLPKVIKEIINKMHNLKARRDIVIKELKQIDEDLLKATYLLAFSKYEGFEDF